MGFRIVYAAPRPHYCDKPIPEEYELDTVIQCDECNAYWQLDWSRAYDLVWKARTPEEVAKYVR